MKRIFTLNSLVFSTLVLFAQQDSIQNPGFEQWTSNPQYDEAIGWTTLNPLAQIFGAELAYKTSDPGELHSGDHAIKLETTNLTGVGITPSILTNGTINTVTQSVEGGVPFSSRPTSFDGWFRFDPANADTGFLDVTLTRWNSTSGLSEVVGEAAMDIATTNGVFVNLQVPFVYSSAEVPDTVLILMGSGTDQDPQVGSALYVDDLSYSLPAGIESPEKVGLSIYPNPAVDELRITSDVGLQFTSANIFGLDGRFIFSRSVSGHTVNVADLNSGAYVLELLSDDNVAVRQSFLKK